MAYKKADKICILTKDGLKPIKVKKVDYNRQGMAIVREYKEIKGDRYGCL